ncbi:MAG TPA: energy transducer TonB [Pelobium sp.]|nr:energy transducer TonB [Pelobium sp.]
MVKYISLYDKLILTVMLFSKIDVNKVEWLNLVFANRNQSYGAYVLRRESGNYLFKSILITGFLFGGALLFSAINSKSNLGSSAVSVLPVTNPDEIRVIPVEISKPKTAIAQPKTSSVSVSTAKADLKEVKFAGRLNPVHDNPLIAEVPTAAQIQESVISLRNNEGSSAQGVNSVSGSNSGEDSAGEGVGSGTDIYNREFVEVMPEFPGGMKAWANFLTRNLNYPSAAAEIGISGKVLVSFVIEKNGEISNLKVLKGIGAGCDEEAMRVIKKSPFWKPGMQNGRAVRVAYIMPIVFRME